ncbi:hypothetical protein BJX99DRAFT_60528 [Aspergillus californicus]
MNYSSPGRPPLASSGPFICAQPNCDKSFLRKEHLNRHLATHTNSRPHKCFICGRSFSRSDTLNRHVLQHNVPADGGKRTPSACQTCRRRRSKCDSSQPCSVCVQRGEICVRVPSNAQTTRRFRRRLDTEEDEEDSTPPARVNAEQDQDQDQSSLQPLLEPCISMVPSNSLLTSTPSRTPSLYSGEPPPFFFFAEKSFPLQSSGSGDGTSADQPEMQMGGSASSFLNSSAIPAAAAWPQLQAQFVTEQIISADFDYFHQAWPFLHVPSFNLGEHTLLTSALANLSIWIRNGTNHDHSIPDSINQELIRELILKITEESDPTADRPLQTLQALVVTLIYAILGDAPRSSLHWAAQWTGIAISTFRRLGALDAQWLPENHQQLTEERWTVIEQMKRLVYTVLRIDAYLSIMLDRPPTLRYHEMRIPLPVSEDVWRAKTKGIRTQLRWNEPAGRARSTFSTMMRDGLDTHGYTTGYLQIPLSLQDNHFSICAFLSDLWAVSKQASEEHHLHYRLLHEDEDSHTTVLLRLWKGHLRDWRIHIDKSDELEDSFFFFTAAAGEAGRDGRNDPFLGINLTLYHLVSLRLYANLRLLEYTQCCGYCQSADVEKVINAWADSADGRHAVYHAVQLKRVYERERTLYRKPQDQRLSNPLGPVGLLASAIVLCLYSAKMTSRLGGNEGVGVEVGAAATPVEAIELTQSKFLDMPENTRWVSRGGLATVDGVPLHAYSVPGFSSWYREQLAFSPVYSSRLVTFLLTLKI